MKRLLLFSLLLSGCARVNVEREYGAMQEAAKCRTGHLCCWERSCEEAECIHTKAASTLTHPRTRNEAVEIALSNNPSLQAAYENLGIAKAAIVQAGLLTNPSLSIDRRFPSQHSPSLKRCPRQNGPRLQPRDRRPLARNRPRKDPYPPLPPGRPRHCPDQRARRGQWLWPQH